MSQKPNPSQSGLVRRTRAFLMKSLETDAIELRPDCPRVRKPITPLAEKLFRTMLFEFENILTGLCFPSIATIAKAVGCCDTSVKNLLKDLQEAGYVTWTHGKRKWVKTPYGWRVVQGSNCYRLLCPFRHLNNLRRELLQFTGGKLGYVVHAIVVRYMPPAKSERPAADPTPDPIADVQPKPTQAEPTPKPGPAPPPRAPPSPGALEVGGVKVQNPKLASVLAGLWAAMERHG